MAADIEPPQEIQLVLELRGSVDALTEAIATLLESGPSSVKVLRLAAPCEDSMYATCPLAKMLEHRLSSNTAAA